MNEHTAALDVAQELMTESRALPRALDKTGNISHYEARALAH